ncbi:MAG: IPTL-CTERM sorting domain-containing protein [Burkholderiales bacterium]|nr:MAG: IPTL-CTERM sorting domain-containing protein [Burkholderiales bacterium]
MRKLLQTVCGLAALAASSVSLAIFQNGGFESGTFANWTQGSGVNNGLTGAQPFGGSSVNLGAGGSFRGAIVSGGPDLVGAPITLPRAGTYTARVNNIASGGIANFISQADTITAADRDPVDNLLHVRFSYAVVLNNPNHVPSEQPFFYLRVRNVTKNTTLFEDFSFAGQSGTQFVPVPTNTAYAYLDWKNADVIVPNADLGDTIEVYLLASDCEPTAHPGYAYLDGFGSAVVVPGPQATATAIPTMNEWALLSLGLLLLGGAAYTGRRS